MTTYTTSLRLWEGTPLDPSIRGAWGPPLNENQNLLESAICDSAIVNLAGLTTYTLTTANGAPDQARPLIQQYTGALTGDCTVTLPNVPKFGYAQNLTTGGHNVILTAGAGVNGVIPADGRFYPYFCDGGANAAVVPLGLGAIVSSSGTFSGSVTIGGGLTVSSNIQVNGLTQVNGLSFFGASGQFYANPNNAGNRLFNFEANNFLEFIPAFGFVWGGTGTNRISAPTIELQASSQVVCSGGSNFVNESGGLSCVIGAGGTQSLNTSGLATNMMNFNVVGFGGIGNISGNGGGGINYNTASDKRLKIDDGSLSGKEAIRILKALRPKWFRWKSQPGEDRQPGFMAQQVARVFPWAVSKGKGRPGSKKFVPWGMDPAKLVPVLVAALQDALARIEALEKGR